MKNLQTFLANFNVVILLVGYQVFTAVFEAIFDVDSAACCFITGTTAMQSKILKMSGTQDTIPPDKNTAVNFA